MRDATCRVRRLVMAAALVAAAAVCTAADATLDVPFVPQGEDLCGGAAAAMVMRYWGARSVYAEEFSALVDRSAGGIRTAALVSDLRGRGWTAVEGASDLASIQHELGRRRPVIVLLEVRPSRYHYVVVIGATADHVVLHDPARGPSRVMSTQSFESAWTKTAHWALLILPASPPQIAALPNSQISKLEPPASEPPASEPPASAPPASGSNPGGPKGVCDIDRAIQLATDGDHAGARVALERATETCSADAAPWRELAGVDALDAHWDAAATHARRALDIDPKDAQAWRILATAEYLRHHDAAALDAWNHVGEPTVDLVDVKGLRDTRYAALVDAMRIAPGQTLTPEALRLAEKRARAVPSIAVARVTFHPVENGRAQVDAAVVERDRAPTSYPSWIALGMNAAANREVAFSLANPSGGGDLITATWRWWTHRPLIAASYAAPAPRALGGGTWMVEASRETQTFSPGALAQTRTHAAFGVSQWLTERTRIAGTIGIDSWSDRGRTPSMSGRVEFWPITDRLSADVNATAWTSSSSFGSGGAGIHWRSSASTSGLVWLAGSGYQIASNAAPAFVWPGADTGHARDVLLRAHPLLDDGIILAPASAANGRVGVFGRRLAFANAELQRWQSVGKWPIRIAPAAFVDTARATRGFDGIATPTQVDAGAGLRVSLLGLGVLRVDVAHGLRDGSNALSVGFVR
jgi:predicted double-glycine peptidase